jgi:hypothetical protein
MSRREQPGEPVTRHAVGPGATVGANLSGEKLLMQVYALTCSRRSCTTFPSRAERAEKVFGGHEIPLPAGRVERTNYLPQAVLHGVSVKSEAR